MITHILSSGLRLHDIGGVVVPYSENTAPAYRLAAEYYRRKEESKDVEDDKKEEAAV